VRARLSRGAPRLLRMNSSRLILFSALICALCASVLSMMIEKPSTYL
jgi:hypothetical protein